MSEPVINLARRGFVNSRPVVRLTLLLWAAGAALTAANVWLYRSYFVGSNERARRINEAEAGISEERRRIAELEAELDGFDLAQQNETVRFLNRKIADRAFAWSRLFDQLAELLPNDVRLLSLTPETEGAEHRRRSRTAEAVAEGPAVVPLRINGEAKSDQALLELVDALFAHPAFQRPNPQREAREASQLLRFDLTVLYLPEMEVELEEEGTAETAAPEGAAGDEPAAAAGADGGPAVATGADGEAAEPPAQEVGR